MSIFDESPTNKNPDNMNQSPSDLGGSLKYVKNDSPIKQGLSMEIANDFQLNFDKFQTRIEIIEQAIEELSMYIDGGASGSSGSQYGDLDGSNDRHQRDTENRLQNILLAYDNLRKDFTQVCQVWKDTAKNYMPASKVMHNMDSTEQIEGSLFQLRMQLDDLERHVNQSRQLPLNGHSNAPINNLDRNQDLVKRMTNLEDKYRDLLGRYHDLKRLSSPSRQSDMEDIVRQLQNVVIEANGRSSIIATPELFENMLHQDLIDSMKRHLSSDSPPYFLTEDGQSSTNSSLGKGRSKRKKGHRLGDDNDWNHQPGQEISPKSQGSPRSIDAKSSRSPPNQIRQYDSQPVSLVSSTSGVQGATSGETLLVDDRGILKEPFRNSSTSLNDVFLRTPNKVETPTKPRNFPNSVDLERSRSRPNSSGLQNLDEDVKRLDEHLARIELEEKNRSSEHMANRDSDAAPSRNTRSLLGTSPSNSNYSRQSKHTSSVGSGHGSTGVRRSNRRDKIDDIRKKSIAYKMSLESTDSGEESASYGDDDLEDYVRGASCGIGPRSRYVRKKNNNVQDRWSQTPLRSYHKSPRLGAYDRDLSPAYDNPYVDDVAYWDGIAFHPAREGLPGKSILRQSSPHSKRRRKHLFQDSLPTRSYNDSFSRPSFPVSSRIPYSFDPSLREYSTMGPHRYFVREYPQLNRTYPYHMSMYDNYDDYDDGEDDYYRKCVEERRMCNYLDEAMRAARDMKQYTRRLTNLCEQRQYGRNDIGSYPHRNFRPLYT